MNANPARVGRDNTNRRSAFAAASLKSCRTILAQVRQAKEDIVAAARRTLRVHERMVQLVLNEAEAVAWQTSFPHLVFPTLATEKVTEAVTWNRRQRHMGNQAQPPKF
jgi:hypothetical protein